MNAGCSRDCPLVEKMRNAIIEDEKRIRELEKANQILRARLKGEASDQDESAKQPTQIKNIPVIE